VLRNLFGPERDEVTADWKKSHSVKRRDPYCVPNQRVIKPTGMRLTGNVVRMREGDVHTVYWRRNQNRKDYLKDLDVNGRIILN
jgi:hypothetical protein